MNTPRTDAKAARILSELGPNNNGRFAAMCDFARKLELELIALERRESILVDAMSEIKATSDGKYDQPIADIVAGCIVELSQANVCMSEGADKR